HTRFSRDWSSDVCSSDLKKASADTTQFTRYNSVHSDSTGFEKAQRLAQQTLNNGMLLKKRFVLEEALGHGGMGTVYSAKDLRKEIGSASGREREWGRVGD